ncbi:MAG TPA: hypothetical protein VK121_03015 [Pseudogracilibacillus sp.]|nr:hypothetical protein [Pseudogracilibacillus sp.]
MKFSKNGYYIESYDKCSVCGKLIYEGEEYKLDTDEANEKMPLYCSKWCADWEKRKTAN